MNRKVTSQSAQTAAIKFATELQKYPIEVAVGVGIVIPNLVNGCSWGFVNESNEEFKKCLDAINSNPNMSSAKIKGGYLVNINMNYLLPLLSKITSGFVTDRDLQIASEHRRKALLD